MFSVLCCTMCFFPVALHGFSSSMRTYVVHQSGHVLPFIIAQNIHFQIATKIWINRSCHPLHHATFYVQRSLYKMQQKSEISASVVMGCRFGMNSATCNYSLYNVSFLFLPTQVSVASKNFQDAKQLHYQSSHIFCLNCIINYLYLYLIVALQCNKIGASSCRNHWHI